MYFFDIFQYFLQISLGNRKCKYKGKTLKSHYNANLKGKTSKIPRQCKFKRKNANIKGKTLALSWDFSVFPFIFAFFLLNLLYRGILAFYLLNLHFTS
jgi:hypothetical protein